MNKLKWLLIVFMIFLILFILIIVTKLKVIVDFYHGQDNDDLKIEFKAWFGLIRYKIHVPLVKLDAESKSIISKEKTSIGPDAKQDKKTNKFTSKDLFNSLHDTKVLLHHVIGFHKIIRKFLHKVKLKNLEWETEIGVGDAAYTGMLIGAIWGIKGSIIGIFSNYMRLMDMPKLSVQPNFQKAISQTRFQCMFQFRIGQAMFAAIKLVKYWKGGKPNFKSKSLSPLSNNN
ncbi:DUF2953 domain-containing protein [Cytobacillus sp. Hz8]|uniref:DUF2953 domain-containing protein n=1 Tax=Cytobacillus sp. Hz8 TaxID=3347168 RepID=UPI0035D9E3D2